MKLFESKTMRRVVYILQLAVGVFVIGVGVSIILRENFWWNLINQLLIVGSSGILLVFLYQAVFNRSGIDFLIALGAGGFLALVLLKPEFHKEFFALPFGLWALFNAAVRALELFVAYRDKRKWKSIIYIEFLVELGMGLLLVFTGMNNVFLINIQVGVYVMMNGLMQMLAVTRVYFNAGYTISMPAPVFLTAFLPSMLVKRIQDEVQKNPQRVIETVEATYGKYVSIYIYAKNHGYNRMGHIDIGYNGAIYSYGCHDPYNRAKSQAFGDGVLIVGSEADYVQYCVDDDTTVFRFLCELTDEQQSFIEKRIDEILEPAYYYTYPLDRKDSYDYFLGFLKEESVNVDYYKFLSGPFKTYNVFSTNCVLVADAILRSTGMQLFHLDGIITPGTYYQYLHKNVNKPGSIVVREDIYKKIGAKPKHDS